MNLNTNFNYTLVPGSNETEDYQNTNNDQPCTYTITQYDAINKPSVSSTLCVDSILEMIKTGNEYLPLIEKARSHGKGSDEYDSIKTNQLPTFRFNFLFKEYAKNLNISTPTGLIYLDLDNQVDIAPNEYIFAKWRSLSNLGYGILVKIDNLTVINFSDAYNQLSKVLGIHTDQNARKVTQQTVLSFDSNIYINHYSTVYHYQELKKVSLGSNLIKKEECIIPYDTFPKKPIVYNKIRYNNIDDYFVGENADVPYLVFSEEKTKICQPYIPKFINEGSRNTTMFAYLSNIATLNPNCSKELLYTLSCHVNDRMEKSLSANETNRIINNVLQMRDHDELTMYRHKERRFLFNPNSTLSKHEKNQITGHEIGRIRKEAKSKLIYNYLENWDFETNGKITQKKLSEVSNIPLQTLKKPYYWTQFKDYVGDLNSSFLNTNLSD